MKRFRLRAWIAVLALVAGVGLIVSAILATHLGIDPNADWGPSRWFMLETGILLASLSTLWLAWGPLVRLLRSLASRIQSSALASRCFAIRARLGERWHSAVGDRPVVLSARRSTSAALARLRALPPIAWLLASNTRLAMLSATLVSVGVLVVYWWIVSVGFWIDWPATTDHYDKLADAFVHGQLHLRIEPDPALLALPDPYQLEARQTVSYIWDMVLYQGRYYLYWGPAPAVLLAAIKSVLAVSPGDQVLVFVSIAATFLVGVLLTLALWRRFFAGLPWWTAALPLAVLGLANPMPWLLSRPGVYEAAIGAGQLFLLAGTFLAITALRQPSPLRWRLAAAGLCWAAAVGSRASLAVSVSFLATATAAGLSVSSWQPIRIRRDLRSLATLFVPLIVGAALLAGYNFARFGSPWELGHRYQLTAVDMVSDYRQVFSPIYLALNGFNYLFNPYHRLDVFPFVKPMWATRLVAPLHLLAPDAYRTEQVTGILVATPFALYALVACILVWRIRRRMEPAPASHPPESDSLAWIHVLLAGGILCAALPLLSFVYVTQRYLADFLPLLLILASLGFWQAHQALIKRPSRRRFHLWLALTLMAYSAAVGLLLAVTGYQARFEHLNPALFEQITRFFAL